MYKSLTPEDYKKHFNLPEGYHISGFLSYGTWDEESAFHKLCEVLNLLEIKYTFKKLSNFLERVYEFNIHNKIYWISFLYGGAMLSEYIHLACIFDSQANIHIGSCGGLFKEMNSLDFLIPTYSYGNESTTRMYARDVTDNKHFPDKKLSDDLVSELGPVINIWRGGVVTCQAMLGETSEDIKVWSEDAYYGVEMETSTLFAISNHFKVPSAALLFVEDNLIKKQTVHSEGFLQQESLRDLAKNTIFKVGLSTLIKNS